MTPGGPLEENNEFAQPKPSNPFPPSQSTIGAGAGYGPSSNPFGGTPGGPSEFPEKDKQPDSFERVFENKKEKQPDSFERVFENLNVQNTNQIGRTSVKESG